MDSNKFQISNNKFQISTNILGEIVQKTREDVEARKRRVPLEELKRKAYSSSDPAKPENREDGSGRTSFARAIKNARPLALIAEIKLASPTAGDLGKREDILSRAKQYQEAGADVISIVTEKYYFKGDPLFMLQIKQKVSIPILQKDFVIDPYQIHEAKAAGADAVLLIAKILTKEQLRDFVALAVQLGVEPLIEIDNAGDLEKAIVAGVSIIAVNARNLDTFAVDVDRACRLMKRIPNQFVKLGFSGIATRLQVEQYAEAGAHGILIGTSLMKAKDIGNYIQGVRV